MRIHRNVRELHFHMKNCQSDDYHHPSCPQARQPVVLRPKTSGAKGRLPSKWQRHEQKAKALPNVTMDHVVTADFLDEVEGGL